MFVVENKRIRYEWELKKNMLSVPKNDLSQEWAGVELRIEWFIIHDTFS